MAVHSHHYDYSKIEKHWQSFWDQNNTFKAVDLDPKPKYYILDMFPYPSGEGLHVGHPEGYTATDILGRYKMANGFNVLHPMGWDAFGLPAENHAVKTGTHPAINTKKNISVFKEQLKSLGFGFDWSREIATTDPEYYKWTQWIFLQLFKKGLAYVDNYPVWWCPAMKTILANEEVVDGKSERGNHPVERRYLRQWVLRITKYADKLLDGLDDLDWPDSTKRMQRAWIGKSTGANIHFNIDGIENQSLTTFTTRPDTLYGVAYLVIAPEHPLVDTLTSPENKQDVDNYKTETSKKSDLARTDLAKYKSGVFTGSFAIHPLTNQKLPIWVADYVLPSYGTGVIMAVPAHDERDHEFSKQYNLPIPPVITKDKDQADPTSPFFGQGFLINSAEFNGLHSKEAGKLITEKLSSINHGEPAVNFKLRDWLFSRQRYWGEPFPVIWIDENAYKQFQNTPNSPIKDLMPSEPVVFEEPSGDKKYALPVIQEHLPQNLPDVESYLPSDSGESPLGNAQTWLNIHLNLQTGEISESPQSDPNWVKGRRETNTMPNWAGSCWYYLRFLDSQNNNSFLNPELAKYWGVPDLYIGGAEHSVLHLLYARFWHQVLFDLNLVPTQEPFPRVVHQGLILGEPEFVTYKDQDDNFISIENLQNTESPTLHHLKPDEVITKGNDSFLKSDPSIKVEAKSFKMSKSRGNVINPDTIIKDYGTDALRMYEMFLGPLEANKPWNTENIEGITRFLRKIWRETINEDSGALQNKIVNGHKDSSETIKILQQTIKKVSDDIEALRFNTAISQLMIFMNHVQKQERISNETISQFIQMLAPFAPHISEELWERLGHQPSVCNATWPKFDPSKLISDEVKYIVQVNGKLRDQLVMSKDASKDDVLSTAKNLEKLKPFLDGTTIVKEIFVPGKIVNLVVK